MRLPTAGEVYGVPTQRVIEIPDIHQPAVESVQEIGLQPILAAAVQCSTQERRSTPRKRHIVVDTLGLLVVVLVTAASVQDRDGGARVLDRAKMAMPSLALIFADGGYAGRLVAFARRMLRIVVHVVRKPEGQCGFAVLPRRPVVERTLSWLTAHRHLARDYERLPEYSEAWVTWAMIGLMTRRLAPGWPPHPAANPDNDHLPSESSNTAASEIRCSRTT